MEPVLSEGHPVTEVAMFIGFAAADVLAEADCALHCTGSLVEALASLARFTRQDAEEAPGAHRAVAHSVVRCAVLCLLTVRRRGLGASEARLRAAWGKMRSSLCERAPPHRWAREYERARLAGAGEVARQRGPRSCAPPRLLPSW
jgi:hypothetical protein